MPILWRAVGAQLVLVFAVALQPSASAKSTCNRPTLNITAFPDECTVLRRACVFQQTIVTFDPDYQDKALPEIPFERWNFPSGLSNSDALYGQQPWFRLTFRRPTALEPPELRQPIFSNCTTPLVLMHDWAFNVGEFLAEALTMLHAAFFVNKLDRRLTLVYALPEGLGPLPFHRQLLAPFTQLPVVPLWEVGRAQPGAPADWAWEGTNQSCFEEMAFCKWQGGRNRHGSPLSVVAAEVVQQMGVESLPEDPLGFGGSRNIPGYRDWSQWDEKVPEQLAAREAERAKAASEAKGGSPPKLRVLIESRHGLTRVMKNLDEVLEACRREDKNGFEAGPFRGISCRPYSFSDTHNSTVVGRDHFRAIIAAVRSAHVLVMQHGAGAINSFFMRQGHEGPSALVEMRPCQWGSKYGFWPDSYEPLLHARTDAVRCFAYNIEDKSQCQPSDYMAMVSNGSLHHTHVSAIPAMRARDQHMVVNTTHFFNYLRHVAELMPDVEQYRAARKANRLHVYVRPSGLLFGPLGVKDLNGYVKKLKKRKEREEQKGAGKGGTGSPKGSDRISG